MMAINFPSPAINDNKMTSGSAGAISDPKSPACILASFNDGFDTLFHYWKLPYLQVAAIFQTCDIATLRLKISEIFFQCNQWCSPLTLKRYDRYPKQWPLAFQVPQDLWWVLQLGFLGWKAVSQIVAILNWRFLSWTWFFPKKHVKTLLVSSCFERYYCAFDLLTWLVMCFLPRTSRWCLWSSWWTCWCPSRGWWTSARRNARPGCTRDSRF